jgi:hypothetical protein
MSRSRTATTSTTSTMVVGTRLTTDITTSTDSTWRGPRKRHTAAVGDVGAAAVFG